MTKLVLLTIAVIAAVSGVAALAGAAGFAASGGVVGGSIGAVLAVTLLAANRPKVCPRCAADLPKVRRPRSLHQAMWGGITCPSCGCEIDRRGRETARDR